MQTELLPKPILDSPPLGITLLDDDDPETGDLFLIEYPGDKIAVITLKVQPGDAIAVASTPSAARRLLEWIEASGGKVRATTLDEAADIAASKPPCCIGVALVDDIDNPKLIRKVR